MMNSTLTAPNRVGPPTWRRRGLLLGGGTAAAVLLVLGATGCDEAPPSAPPPPPEVQVTTPVNDPHVVDYREFTGRLDALKTVDVRPRVTGYVQDYHFKEGDLVKEGQVLFEIDPRSYQADYNLALAQIRLQEATLAYADAVYKRDLSLRGESVSKEDLQKDLAARDTASAQVNAAKATAAKAKLYLDWTKVVCPLSGRIGRRLVDPGNIVNADTTVLANIVPEDQLYAYFDVDERTYEDLRQTTGLGPSSATGQLRLPVLMRLANEEQFKRLGMIDFVDNRVNANAGTVRLRGVFDNKQRLLKAGMFVRIQLPTSKPYAALVIPDEALLSDQGRKFVYVVNAKGIAEYRSVELGRAVQGLRVITKGLAPGEQVVVNGTQRVRRNAPVQAKMIAPPKVADSPLARMLAAVPANTAPTK
jgi:RND family efflux transporter MFP subunit